MVLLLGPIIDSNLDKYKYLYDIYTTIFYLLLTNSTTKR